MSIKQLLVIAYTDVVPTLFPEAMPVAREMWTYRVSPGTDVEAVLAQWGNKHKIRLQNFIGHWPRITHVWVHGRTVLATAKDYVYVLSTEGLHPLYDAVDVANYVANYTDNHVQLGRGGKGLFSKLVIEGMCPKLTEIAEAASSLVITDDPVTVSIK